MLSRANFLKVSKTTPELCLALVFIIATLIQGSYQTKRIAIHIRPKKKKKFVLPFPNRPKKRKFRVAI